MKLVLICHPMEDDLEQNLHDVFQISHEIFYSENPEDDECVPFIPHIHLLSSMIAMDGDVTEKALRQFENMTTELIERHSFDECWIYGETTDEFVIDVIRHCMEEGIPIVPKSDYMKKQLGQ